MATVSDTYEPGAHVTVTLAEGNVAAVVVHDNGGETVVVRYPHPHLDREANNVPVLRIFVSAASGPPAEAPPDQ